MKQDNSLSNMPQGSETALNLIKLPSLDGWRAFSILLVLLAHSGGSRGFPSILLPVQENGAIGVRFFFVISGFLITWLLLQEYKKNETINLKHFYLRRVLRIFPVYYFYLAVVGLLITRSQSALSWLANLTFTTDFIQGQRATNHLWSLAVEEQFYLLWPSFLVFTLICGGTWRSLIKYLLVPVLIAPFARFVVYSSHPQSLNWLFQPFSFIYQSDSLAFGCIGAILFVEQRELVAQLYDKYAGSLACLGIALILFPMIAGPRHWIFDRLGAMFFNSTQGVGFSILLLQSILRPKVLLYKTLNWRWIRHIGILSYSIYIWQQMFFDSDTIFPIKDAWWASFPTWILIALIVAHASYYLLERPLFGLRKRFRAA